MRVDLKSMSLVRPGRFSSRFNDETEYLEILLDLDRNSALHARATFMNPKRFLLPELEAWNASRIAEQLVSSRGCMVA